MFVALSLFLPYLAGLGRFVQWLLLRRPADRRSLPGDGARAVAVTLGAGVLANYVLLLILQRIDRALVIGSAFAAAGLLAPFRGRSSSLREAFITSGPILVVAIYVILLYLPSLFLEPLTFWDARSIWFFHAKIMFYNGALNQASGWGDPTLTFSLVPYPKLVPSLAAQFAYAAGFWNELFPKAALLVVLIPAVAGVFAVTPKVGFSALYLASASLFFLGQWLWNGAMDGFVAIYAALATLFVGRWLEQGRDGDIYAGLVCLGIVTNLKSEGILFGLAIAGSVLMLVVWRRQPRLFVRSKLTRQRTWLWLGFSLSGLIGWHALKWKWGIATEPTATLAQVKVRLIEGALPQVLKSLLFENGVAKGFALFFMALALARAFSSPATAAAWLPFMTATVYFAGMTLVYLGTQYPLTWHLATSSDRTALTILLMLSAASYVLLQRLEHPLSSSEAP